MATSRSFQVLKTKFLFKNLALDLRCHLIHTSPVCSEVQSGRVKVTPKRNKPVTYERYYKPHFIGSKKSWNSWNTSTLEGGLRTAETATDDMFIRKFVEGTFPGMVLSEVIIKRQYNIIRIAAIIKPRIHPSGLSFLIGYTETLLSYWFQCIVKFEIQTVNHQSKVYFQYV